MFENQLGDSKRWARAALGDVEKLRRAWLESNRTGVSPRFDEVKVGDALPRRVIGPHTIASFTTEYRAFLFNIWGTFHWVAPPGTEDPWVYQDPGWGKDFACDEEDAKIDPRKRDGLYVGTSRGHIDAERASEVGMAGGYGNGATVGAWCTDYLAYWAGHDGMVRHTKADFRTPAFEGDVTYFDAEIIDKQTESTWPPELDYLIRASAISMLLLERSVLSRDFAAVLAELEPAIGASRPGRPESARYPFLRRLAAIGEPAPGIEAWDELLASGDEEPRELVEATAAAVQPSDAAVLFFSPGPTSGPSWKAHRTGPEWISAACGSRISRPRSRTIPRFLAKGTSRVTPMATPKH
jgi:hypothetical protein